MCVPLRPQNSLVALDNGQLKTSQEANTTGIDAHNQCLSSSNTSDGVSPDCVWFLMRAAYGQELKAKEFLTGKAGIAEVFCPQWMKERFIAGKKVKKMVSVLPNALFVRSTDMILKQFVGVPPMTFLHYYYQPYKDDDGREIESGRKPIVIPDSQMLSFRKWLESDKEDKIYMNDTFQFKHNDLVRVTEGDFEGFTGHVVRLKGQTRVGVNIEGVGFICTTYIPKYCLEIIPVNT